MINPIALSLASTIRHDGHGGIADDLAEIAGLTVWVREHADDLGPWARSFASDEVTWSQVLEVRKAVRALFAYAVRPGPSSRADSGRLMPREEAIKKINNFASRVPVKPHLIWSDAAEPRLTAVTDESDPALALPAALARATMEFLVSPDRTELRACTAPRCVRYFIKEHGRQEFCKPACSNRARAARHYEKSRNAG